MTFFADWMGSWSCRWQSDEFCEDFSGMKWWPWPFFDATRTGGFNDVSLFTPQCDYFTILGMGGIRPPDRLVITGVLWDSIPWTRHDFPDEIPIVRRLNPKLPVDGHWISHSNLHLWRISGWFSCWFHADFMLILYWPLRQALLVGRGAWWGGAFDGHRSGDGSAARRGQREPVGPAGMVEMDGMDDNFHGIFWWFFGISQVDIYIIMWICLDISIIFCW